MSKRSFVFSLTVFVSLVVVALCFASLFWKYQQVRSDSMPTIRYVGYKVIDPVYVALERGLFEEHGVKVEIAGDAMAGATVLQVVSSGQAEAGLTAIPSLINANAAGLPVIGVSDIQSALPDFPLEHYYVLKGGPISAMRDLPGAKFAVNNFKASFHYTALMALDQNSIDPQSLEFVLLPFTAQVPALLAGEVDVIGLMEPYNSIALQAYGDQLQPLFDAVDVFGSKQFTLHFFNRIWAEQNPAAVEAFVAAVKEAADLIENDLASQAPILAKYTGAPVEAIAPYSFQPCVAVVEDDVAFWIDYLRTSEGTIPDWLNAGQVATNEYSPCL